MSRGLSPTRLIARFAVRIALLVAFAAFGSVGFARSLSALLWMSIILCALAGLVRREPLFGAVLRAGLNIGLYDLPMRSSRSLTRNHIRLKRY